MESVDDTNNSGVENGGHVLNGESRATRWDSGPKPRIEENDGAISVVASIVPFIQNGKRVHVDVSNISFTWHVHPNVSLAGGQLGSSNPSEYDYSFLAKMRPFGYTGNPFIIGTNNNSVSFYNERRVIKRISYKNFLLMGGKK